MYQRNRRRGRGHRRRPRHPDGRLAVLAWAPVDVTGAEVVDEHRVRLDLPFPHPAGFVLRSRVHEEAGNAHTAWVRMGRPASPHARQLSALREASVPARTHARASVVDGRLALDVNLERHEITLIECSPVIDETPSWWDDRRMLGLEAG